MKIKLIIIALMILSISFVYAQPKVEKIEIKTSAVCEHCKENIENALNKVDGVKKSNLDVKSKIATVEFDSKLTNPEDLRKAISKAGYNADDIKRDSRAYKRLAKCCKSE